MSVYQYRNTGTNQVVYVPSAMFAGNPLWELISGPGAGGGDVTQADLDALESDTTGPHGVADFSALVTDDEASAKVVAHSADTTSVHGIADTTVLETTAGAQEKATAAALASIPLIQKGAANGVATLGSDSKIPAGQVPAISLTDYLGPVANQAAMLALVPGQLGDWTIRTDLSTTWVISGADATQLANWTELGYPNAVTQVAGKTGIVTLAGEDIASGTIAVARLPVGTDGSSVAAGNDSRITGAATSAALTSGLAGKVAKTEVALNVRDYGAVGDCAFVDQRVTGTWGLASASIVNALTYGRGYTNSGYTVAATDNTTAFRAAWDALVDEGRLSLREKTTGVYTGYRGQRRELHIPAGAYYISDAGALFSHLRTTPNGTQAGITVRGDGQENTVLYVRIPNSGSTDYMVYDVDKINRFEMRDLTIVCTTGTERLFYSASSTGQTGRWYFDRVSFWEYLTCFQIAGTVNADRWVLNACDWQTAVAQATLLTNSTNSQAVDFTFTGPSITHFHGGNIFNIAAGGNIKLIGGAGRIAGAASDGAEGVLVKVDGTGGLVGQQNYPAFTAYGHRLEIVDSGGLCDINISEVVFRDCIAFPTNDIRTKPHCIVRTTGRVVWDGGIWGDLTVGFSNSYLNDYQLSNKASMYIRNAKIKNNSFLTSKVSYFTDAGDGLTTVFGTTGTGGPARGRIFVEGCDPYGVTYGTTRILQNGAPYAWYGWHGRPAKVHREIMRQGSALGPGLGDETQSSSVIIPTQCEIIRVGIVKGSGNTGIGGNSRTWSIKDADGTTLVSLTALGTDTWVRAAAEINRVVSTINTRTLSLTCAASSPASNGTYADGYWFVEYV